MKYDDILKDGVCEEKHYHRDKQKHVNELLPNNEEMNELADLYKIFADATRIRILCALLDEELCVCDISDLLQMEQSAISHQLRVLKQAKLVNSRREGKAIFYSLADKHISEILAMGLDHIRE